MYLLARPGRGCSETARAASLPPPLLAGGPSSFRVQRDDHHVQANLAAAKATTHTMRNMNIETAKLACFLNSLRPSLIRVVRRKKTERTKRKTGIATPTKATILKIISHCQIGRAHV